MKPIISFQHYGFKYKNQSEPTLKDITLDVYPGEKIWIAGPSGSGKSTLAHCINGLIPFTYGGETSGSLIVGGEEPVNLSIFELSRTVGTILQDQDSQFVGLSVGEDVAFVMENKALPREQMKVDVVTALNMVDMLDYIEHSPYELSGGQKQHVSLAGVLSTDAEVLLFDEPLANLDPASGRLAMQLIDDIHRDRGKTIIIIEHRVEDVLQQPVDRIVLMNEGSIAVVGTPDEILSSGVLRQYGLRPPLYADALEYAGIALDAIKGLSIPQKLDVAGLKDTLNAWSERSGVKPEGARREPLLSAQQLTFGYNLEHPVVRDASLNIGAGEIVALLGNNGAGKSTLSQLITGILKPQSGKLTFAGEDISSWSIRRRGEQIGYVMQNPNRMITQHMISEEVGLGLKVRGIAASEIQERVEQVLKVCGLYAFRNWPVSALSYGQKKRLSIAAILVLEPKLIILDEPTAGQDYQHYKEFMDFIHTLSEQGVGFLLITHDMYLALEYADRAIVLHDGRIIAEDTVAAVLSNQEVTSAARLKETSLSLFAKANDLTSPAQFVQAFINEEKKGKAHE
ncbi:ABC transporter ATP-binding protein [Paenibacillus pini]|uniref:Duplicated ATPase component MtsB n=1 Tax=Paenibacillus pini JCM 16418 TaxID=1236976 RepID=W7YZS4_9BACL|nr:ABC transporter ATP-binding protein [Paenibacillus pini]GAF10176.1 duplicated ATPase component MtsB [Paenibacillus pini JCM 16418]